MAHGVWRWSSKRFATAGEGFLTAQRRILVTGATGLIGSRLIARASARGIAVRAAIRSGRTSVESVVVGDIGPETDWAPALDGCDTVIHLAAATPGPRVAPDDFHRVNVLGTRRLVDACLAANVRRLVFASSIFAVAERSSGAPLDDTSATSPSSPYGQSKLAAEAEIARFAKADQVGISLRFPLVYDVHAKGNWAMLLRLAWSGLPLPFGSIANRRSLVGLDNAVDAILTAASTYEAVCGAFCIDEGPPIGLDEIVGQLRSGMRIEPRLFGIDSAMLRFPLRILGLRRTGRSLFDDLWVDGSRFRETYEWSPLHQTLTGMETTGAEFGAMMQARMSKQ